MVASRDGGHWVQPLYVVSWFVLPCPRAKGGNTRGSRPDWANLVTEAMRETDGMRVLAIVHEAEAGPGVLGEAIRDRGATLDEWMLPESAEPPADPLGY